MAFVLAKAIIDGAERFAPIAVSALPHLPEWTAVDPDDVRANPWDFEEPEDTAVPAVGPVVTRANLADGAPAPAAEDVPAGNAGTDVWRDYAETQGVGNAGDFSRDELRDHFLNDQPLPSKEH